MEKHFVTYLSPGTFFSEQTEKPIESWDVEKAVEMAGGIRERYGATPFAFYFTTRGRRDDELDSREIKRSGRYYLGGTIRTLEEIERQQDPSERILAANMRCNGWDRVIVNTNSWKATQPFEADDTLLDYTPPAVAKQEAE